MISVKNIFITAFMLLQSVIFVQDVVAQKRGAVWCFGDSALVDFSDTSNITFGTSSLKTRGSCASICDTSGNLLFYAGYDTDTWVNGGPAYKNVEVFNMNHTTMVNGDSIIGQAWYRELVITDDPSTSNQYYVFSIGVTAIIEAGFYYSIVDMNANGGMGEVIQKNVQLQTFNNVDCLSAVKHGNGRDWWVFFRKSDFPSGSNNDFYIILISPAGITLQSIQSVGSNNSTNLGRISFNSSGNKMCFINLKGLIELYDFDRCTGIISNPVTISQENTTAPYPFYWSAEFSPSGNLLYATNIAATSSDSSRLYQFDLTAPNIAASKQILWTTPFITTMGQLKRAPDNKIYLTTNYYQLYPYLDTEYNYINKNLSVINSPDNLGFACDLDTFSFYLGGKRSYLGLPNNPDYDLGSLVGSPCDTLVSLNELAGEAAAVGSLHVYYHTAWEKAFINAEHLKGKAGKLLLYNLQGQLIHEEPLKIQNGYYTKDLSMMGQSSGMYLVVVETEKERLTKKLVKQ